MSNNNEGQEPTPPEQPSEPVITFEVFKAFYDKNIDLDNAEYYKAFPTVNTGTVRSWKSRARTPKTEPEPPKQPTDKDKIVEMQKQFYETLMATADHKTKGFAKVFYDKGDIDSALVILQENAKNQPPMPNAPTIPTPTGIPKLGLEKYMKYVPGSEKISWEIPASVLLDPEKNKKLGEYQ